MEDSGEGDIDEGVMRGDSGKVVVREIEAWLYLKRRGYTKRGVVIPKEAWSYLKRRGYT